MHVLWHWASKQNANGNAMQCDECANVKYVALNFSANKNKAQK